ncbi:iron export ABC transporter permease subunit FetB [Synechococcus sp. RSCCF101]|uniref:ABC transporter permease n=1 Tax=Synechococcus sp. RSCCF101 TaxID=2511069 RepID=UPI0012443A3A|nr:iron export ABC transporter permease subunit FetB [Synechococcus sp. RSCCF101]QEY31270.1 iron export ABC transporter permease subunit FetB [Synechococcus sp. RSCCF101]
MSGWLLGTAAAGGSGAIPIGPLQLVGAASLILVNVGLSALLQLGLARGLVTASLRMVVQLLLTGTALGWVFRQDSPGVILLLALLMGSVAGHSAVSRTRQRFPGIHLSSMVSVLTSAALVTGVAVGGILRPAPWYDPQYLIPLLGMVLGNTLNGISLGLDTLMGGLQEGRHRIEQALAVGAGRWEASASVVREAVRVAMVPTINAMTVMGVVSLPGMMTGQILEGALPAAAVRYQIVIMFMIAAATALGVVAVVVLGFLQLSHADGRLRLERLQPADRPGRRATTG